MVKKMTIKVEETMLKSTPIARTETNRKSRETNRWIHDIYVRLAQRETEP